MADGDIEVYHEDDQWYVRRQGESKPLSDHDTKEAAMNVGRLRADAEDVEFVEKDLGGRIDKKDSHGNDPSDIPG